MTVSTAIADSIANIFLAAVRRMLSRRFTKSNLPAAIEWRRGSCPQSIFPIGAIGQHANIRDGCDASELRITRLGKVQIWREQRSASEARRSGGEYPRLIVVLRNCEVMVMTADLSRLPIQSN